jgi:hypothetical protein
MFVTNSLLCNYYMLDHPVPVTLFIITFLYLLLKLTPSLSHIIYHESLLILFYRYVCHYLIVLRTGISTSSYCT